MGAENEVLRGMFGSGRDEVIKDRRN